MAPAAPIASVFTIDVSACAVLSSAKLLPLLLDVAAVAIGVGLFTSAVNVRPLAAPLVGILPLIRVKTILAAATNLSAEPQWQRGENKRNRKRQSEQFAHSMHLLAEAYITVFRKSRVITDDYRRDCRIPYE